MFPMSAEPCRNTTSAPLHLASPAHQGPGYILVMKTAILQLFGGATGTWVRLQGASRWVHPLFGVQRWKMEVEPQGFSRTTHSAGGRGRTCRGGGHPGGSTRSPLAPSTGASRSSGGEREKGGHVLGVPMLHCM